MDIRFFVELGEQEPHFQKHGVASEEVLEFFQSGQVAKRKRKDGSIVGYGRLQSGRYLTVVYREQPDHLFVITAFDLTDRALIDILSHRLDR